MSFLKRAKKPSQVANPPLDGSQGGAPFPEAELTATNVSQQQNQIELARTRTEDIVYPHGLKLALIMTSSFTSMFLVALDRLIITTAIPKITDEFHSQTDIGWYGSAYMLTNCAFQLSFGKLYTFYSVKTCFLCAIALFEIGSAVCGAAPSSTAFIVGRAIAGMGSAGIMSGTITVIVYALPLHRRPIFQGLFGAVFGLASVVGPLLGGAFTTDVSWRWCFYINLPFGGVAMAFIFLLLKIPDRAAQALPTKQKLSQLDFLGIFFFLPGVVCLLLALQWGGTTYAWNNGRIIALLVLAGVLLIGFVAVQVLRPETATIPPRIFCQRSIIAGFWVTFCIGASMMIIVYYLPIWFQAIEGVSAVNSGIRLLPLVLSMVLASITSGFLVARIGYYTPFLLVGICILSVGAGLLTTLQVDTSEGKWIGYQVIYGFGMGCSFQAPNLAAQTVLPTRDVPVGTSLILFSQLLGSAIFTSVGNNVLDNELLKKLAGIPGVNPDLILAAGATEFLSVIPASAKAAVLKAYNSSLRVAFVVGLAMTCLTIFGALALEWRSTKSKQPSNNKEAVAEKGEAAAAAAAAGGGGAADAMESGKEEMADEEDAAAAAAAGDDDAAAAVTESGYSRTSSDANNEKTGA